MIRALLVLPQKDPARLEMLDWTEKQVHEIARIETAADMRLPLTPEELREEAQIEDSLRRKNLLAAGTITLSLVAIGLAISVSYVLQVTP